MDNVIYHNFTQPPPPDPWLHAQPSMVDKGDREELWSHTYFGISHMIWATGSNHVPDPPTPTGGTPAANTAGSYQRLKVAA